MPPLQPRLLGDQTLRADADAERARVKREFAQIRRRQERRELVTWGYWDLGGEA